MRRAYLGDVTPQGAVGAAGSIASAAAQGGLDPLSDIKAAMAIFGLFGSKPSDFGAFVNFSAGPYPTFTALNNEANKGSPSNNQAGEVLAKLLTGAISTALMRGVTFSNPAFVVVLGSRDPTWLKYGNLGDDKGMNDSDVVQNIGGVGDPIGGASGAWNWLTKYASGNVSGISIEGLISQAQGSVPVASQPVADYASTVAPQSVAPTEAVIGASDYHSVQAAPASVTSQGAPAPAGSQSAPVQAGLFSSPALLIGGGVMAVGLFMLLASGG